MTRNLAKFVESVGGVPVPIGFSEVHQSLARGVVDCAITGPSSANSAGWPEVTQYFLPIGFQIAINGYAVNLDTWNKFSADQQKDPAGRHRRTDRKGVDLFERNCSTTRFAAMSARIPAPPSRNSAWSKFRSPRATPPLLKNSVPNISYPIWAEVLRQAGRRLLGGMEEARRPAGRHAVRLGRPRVPHRQLARGQPRCRADRTRFAAIRPTSDTDFLLDVIR